MLIVLGMGGAKIEFRVANIKIEVVTGFSAPGTEIAMGHR